MCYIQSKSIVGNIVITFLNQRWKHFSLYSYVDLNKVEPLDYLQTWFLYEDSGTTVNYALKVYLTPLVWFCCLVQFLLTVG